MLNKLITWALSNRIIVLLAAAVITVYGIYAIKTTPVDAIPDLSECLIILTASFGSVILIQVIKPMKYFSAGHNIIKG